MSRRNRSRKHIFGSIIEAEYKYAIRRRDPGMPRAYYWCGTVNGMWSNNIWGNIKCFDTRQAAERELKLLMKTRGLKYISVVRYPVYKMQSAITRNMQLYASLGS